MEEWCYSLDLINPARLTQLSSFSKDLFISKSEIINYQTLSLLASLSWFHQFRESVWFVQFVKLSVGFCDSLWLTMFLTKVIWIKILVKVSLKHAWIFRARRLYSVEVNNILVVWYLLALAHVSPLRVMARPFSRDQRFTPLPAVSVSNYVSSYLTVSQRTTHCYW